MEAGWRIGEPPIQSTRPGSPSPRSSARDRGRASVATVRTGPRRGPGRYAELDTGQLADAVERAYESDATRDCELVLKLTPGVVAPAGQRRRRVRNAANPACAAKP